MAGEYIFEYAIIGLFWLLAIFSFLMGTEKMFKLVLGNYIVTTVSLALFTSLSILVQFCLENEASNFLGISAAKRQTFFQSGQVTIVLLVYGVLLFILFTRVSISIALPRDELKKNIILVLLIPLTIFSVIFALEIALLGNKIFQVTELVKFATLVAKNDFMYNFLVLTPLWITLHWAVTLAVITEIEIQYNTPKAFEEE